MKFGVGFGVTVLTFIAVSVVIAAPAQTLRVFATVYLISQLVIFMIWLKGTPHINP